MLNALPRSVALFATARRYATGFQGAFRDPLQHLLPLLLTRPDAARSIIMYSLKEVQAASNTSVLGDPNFLFPWGITSHGLLVPYGLRPSDLECYLFLAVAEYVLYTGDAAFFNASVGVTPYDGNAGGEGAAAAGSGSGNVTTVAALLQRALTYRSTTIGSGIHGLLRMQGSDWSDGFCSKASIISCGKRGRMHTCIHTHVCVHTRVYTLSRVHTSILVCTYADASVHICASVYVHAIMLLATCLRSLLTLAGGRLRL